MAPLLFKIISLMSKSRKFLSSLNTLFGFINTETKIIIPLTLLYPINGKIISSVNFLLMLSFCFSNI